MTKMNTDREWLKKMAEREAEHTVSVGGWITDLEQADLDPSPVGPNDSPRPSSRSKVPPAKRGKL